MKLARWAASAVLFSASPALANGAFPASGQVLRDPTDPNRIVVSTTYGLAQSEDAGASFSLICEEAIGLLGGEHPFLAFTSDGTLVVALPDGLALLRNNGCTVARAPALEGLRVVDVSVAPSGRVIAIASDVSDLVRIFYSDDAGQTFAPLGNALPPKTIPLTLDAAPSDPDRIYVTGQTGNPPLGILLYSSDAAQTFISVAVPSSEASTAPFLAGVDPVDPNRLFVRTNGAPGRLFVSSDGGQSLSLLATTQGFLRAFDLAPTGDFALFGGDLDGLSRLALGDLSIAPHSDVAARCVNVESDIVFACTTPAVEGFSAGRSIDGGVTFDALYDQRCLLGPKACGAGSPVDALCPISWPETAELLGVVHCGEGGAGGQGGAAASTNSGSGAGGDAPQLAEDVLAGGGCSCQVPRGQAPGSALMLALGAGAVVVRRGRKTRR